MLGEASNVEKPSDVDGACCLLMNITWDNDKRIVKLNWYGKQLKGALILIDRNLGKYELKGPIPDELGNLIELQNLYGPQSW